MGHRKGDPRPDEQVRSEPGQNAVDVSNMYTLMKQPRCDMTSVDAVVDRYDWFIDYCISHDMKPTVAGMALAFGYSRDNLLDIKNGKNKGVPKEVCDTLKRAWDLLTALMEEYMVTGRINPVPGIFLLKNNHGYKDQTETVVVKQDPYETGNPEEIARKYLSGMAPALDVPKENARDDAPVVETIVVDQSGTVE